MRPFRLLAACLAVCGLGLAGCSDAPAVRTLTIEPTNRTLIAYATGETQFVQVKLEGPRQYVDEIESAFNEVVESLDLTSQPVGVAMPDGFRQGDGSTSDRVLLVPETGEPVAIEVLSVPSTPDRTLQDSLPRVLVNRLRGELDLPQWTADRWRNLLDESDEVKLTGEGDSERLRVDFVYFLSPDDLPSVILPVEITAEPPAGWDDLGKTQFEVRRFEKDADGGKLVLSLSRSRGSVLENINRWRRQVGLEAVESVDALPRVEVDGESGVEVTLRGRDRAIQGVVLNLETELVFVKLSGPADAVEGAESTLDAFVESVEFG